MKTITVIQVFREKKEEPVKKSTWVVGKQAMLWWRGRTKELPPKRLGRKTCGVGSHCFAEYPEWFRPVIEMLIDQLPSRQPKRQGELF